MPNMSNIAELAPHSPTHHLSDASLHDAVHTEPLLRLPDAHLARVTLLLKDLQGCQRWRVDHQHSGQEWQELIRSGPR